MRICMKRIVRRGLSRIAFGMQTAVASVESHHSSRNAGINQKFTS